MRMNKLVIIGLVTIFAVLGCGVTYYVTGAQFTAVKTDLEKQIENLSQQIVRNQEQYAKDIVALKAEQQKKISSLTLQAKSDSVYEKATADLLPNQPDFRYPDQRGEVLKLKTPKGGEVLCLNHEFEIKWDGSPKISIVNLYLIDPKSGGKYLRIDSVPFTHGGVEGGTTGSYIWRVGRMPIDDYTMTQPVIEAGDAYQIQVNASYPVTTHEGLLVYDLNDKPLSIAKCE